MRNHKCASAFWWTLKAPFCWITAQLHVMSEVTSRAITIGAYPSESCDYVCFPPLRHYRNSPLLFSFFTALFSWVTNKNLQHDHCSSIYNALMMITGVIETFALCCLYRSHWPWFSLWKNRWTIEILINDFFAIFRVSRPATFETGTRPKTFETETRKNGSRVEIKSRDSITANDTILRCEK